MEKNNQAQDFEQVVSDYVEMCYRIALTLTRNPDDAQTLALNTLITTCHRYPQPGSTVGIKTILLTALRERYLKYYCRSQTAGTLDASCVC
jgi:hypothetical protein